MAEVRIEIRQVDRPGILIYYLDIEEWDINKMKHCMSREAVIDQKVKEFVASKMQIKWTEETKL